MTKYIGSELEIFAFAINWRNYWKKFITNKIKGDVLEVGSGIGSITKEFIELNFNSWTSVEPDLRQLQKAKSTILSNRINFINGYSKCVKGHFDTILLIDVLEHIFEDKLEINNLTNLLNTNGNLIILVPAHSFIYSKFDKSIGHYRRYSKQELKRILPKSINIELLVELDALGFILALINRLVFKKNIPSKNNIIVWDKFLIPTTIILDKLLKYKLGKTILLIGRKNNL